VGFQKFWNPTRLQITPRSTQRLDEQPGSRVGPTNSTGPKNAGQITIRTKNSYANALFRRVVARRGGKRAQTAVAHCLLVAAWHVLVTRTPTRTSAETTSSTVTTPTTAAAEPSPNGNDSDTRSTSNHGRPDNAGHVIFKSTRDIVSSAGSHRHAGESSSASFTQRG
jgi:hypothetical protein